MTHKSKLCRHSELGFGKWNSELKWVSVTKPKTVLVGYARIQWPGGSTIGS